MPKKWQVDLKEFEALLNSNYDTVSSLAVAGNAPPGSTCQILVLNGIALGLLAIAERLEVIAVEAVKVNRPLLHPEPEMKIGGTDPD